MSKQCREGIPAVHFLCVTIVPWRPSQLALEAFCLAMASTLPPTTDSLLVPPHLPKARSCHSVTPTPSCSLSDICLAWQLRTWMIWSQCALFIPRSWLYTQNRVCMLLELPCTWTWCVYLGCFLSFWMPIAAPSMQAPLKPLPTNPSWNTTSIKPFPGLPDPRLPDLGSQRPGNGYLLRHLV